MARLVFRTGGIALVLSVIACGGRLDVADPAVDDAGSDTGDHGSDTGGGLDTGSGVDTGGGTDSGVDTGSPLGWHSYTATITDVTQFWKGGSPSGAGAPSKGWTGRVDLDIGNGKDVSPRAIVIPAFGDGQVLTGSAGPISAFRIPGGGNLLSVSGTSGGFYQVTDRYTTMRVSFDTAGFPATALLQGESQAFSGDVGYSADTEATMTFVYDVAKPRWKTSSAATFAYVALPWDQRTFEASEPYETALAPDAWFGSAIATQIAQHPIASFAHEVSKERGIRFELINWDLGGSLTGHWNEVRDFAGNASVGESTDPSFTGAKVASHASTLWRADDALPAAFTWGTVKTTATGCRDGKSCIQIGPFPDSYCSVGSKGGLATRLTGTGTTSVAIRAVARPSATGPGGGGGAIRADVAKLRVATPGGGTSDVASAFKWPSTAASDGSYDTGWTDLSLDLAVGTASETGVALSGGGMGPDGGAGCGGFIGGPPRPVEWDITLYVEQIAVYGKK